MGTDHHPLLLRNTRNSNTRNSNTTICNTRNARSNSR